MGFLLKKIISPFLLPLPITLLLLGVGTILALINKAKRTQYTCLIAGFACLIFFSLRMNAYLLIDTLQSRYQPLVTPPQNVNKIVVLGGGISGGKIYPANIMLRSASLSRLVEGIRQFYILKKHGINATLILSGGRVFESQAEAGTMRNTAIMLGIPKNAIQIEDGSKDTHDEALFLKRELGAQPFILVTSAFHMPRAMELFQAVGTNPIAAPTQFFGPTNLKIKSYIPSSLALEISDITIHEYLGMAWEKLKQQINS